MSAAMKELQDLFLKKQMLKFPNYPPNYFITPKFNCKTANGLTGAIVKYIDLKRGYASRINSGGVYDEKLGTFRHGTTKRGYSDIQALYNGIALYVEVKIGPDKQSPYQVEFQKAITEAGGLYFIAKDFESFHYWFKNVVEKKKEEMQWQNI